MNTDWNSPQGDFDTAEKQGELLMLLSRQQVTVRTHGMTRTLTTWKSRIWRWWCKAPPARRIC